LDLSDSDTAPDFTVVSFYKIFGFPDLGALIVRRQAEELFDRRKYFGGGTVDMVVCLKEEWHASKGQFLHDRLEDGTLPIHNIIALDLAMKTHTTLFGSMAAVAAHTSYLSQRLRGGLASLRHADGTPVCTIYMKGEARRSDNSLQAGPIVAFNIRNQHGGWMSLTEFEKLATAKHFHIRTGGVCNPGGIASALGLEPWEMKRNFSSGFRCGTENDIMGGRPTGVIRASLGAMSTVEDVDKFIAFVEEFYCDSTPLDIPPSPVTRSATRVSNLYVDSIIVYPIKSCGGYKIPTGVEWDVRTEGLAWDREWCLVHRGSGQALSQKRHPRMALLRPELDFVQGYLRVAYSGPVASGMQRQISIPLSDNPVLYSNGRNDRLSSRVCGDDIVAQKYSSDAINNFFSDILAVPCVLARFPAGGQGRSMRHAKAHLQKHQKVKSASTMSLPGSYPAPPSPPDSDTETSQSRILLSNESPILSINLSSLAALNQQIVSRGGEPVPADVFRANIVIGSAGSGSGGSAAPYAEDDWSTLRIGQHSYKMLGSCRRCHMVCINQTTADKNQEPFVTLSKTRRFDGKVFFGTHMALASVSGSDGKMQYPSIKVGSHVMPIS
jgi:molybdenum cofactor sulfurtransferase